ncbi:hypothetical protein MLD38_010792 [Melastoma candidum]|uniref:Uncharacterized protein n=1 Tax=Melastoma candidum TaxID=119954 RepID=A0ACB9R117_9MYRT|nr:hypothetical protein MLD38_010792 [Melastoma candidum]
MAGDNNNHRHHHQDGLGDDFFGVFGPAAFNVPSMGLQLGSPNIDGGGVGSRPGLTPLELNMVRGGFLAPEDGADQQVGRESMHQHGSSNSNNMTNLFSSSFGHLQPPQPPSLRPPPPPQPPAHQPLLHHHHHHHQQNQQTAAGSPIPQATTRPRVRARRGQATDPHSIAERMRRERIAERMKALQELVPGCNKTDRAAMLDEIVDYVKFLRLQVKVLSMSRLGGAGAVAQLVADVPNPSTEGEVVDDGQNAPAWEQWTSDGTEKEVARLMEEDVGAAMQFLQSKALCIMPLSLASAIFHQNQPDDRQ